MTVATVFYDWQRSPLNWDAPPYESCSPNLVALRAYMQKRWRGQNLGCEGDRPVRAGVLPSSHSFGAAWDWRWEWFVGAPLPVDSYLPRSVIDAEVLPFLIDNSAELGIQAVHDEGRIWRAWRSASAGGPGWKPYPTGYDGWLHIETHLDSFGWSTPIVDRLAPPPLPPPTPRKVITMYRVQYRRPDWPGAFEATVSADRIDHSQSGRRGLLDAAAGVPIQELDRAQVIDLLSDAGLTHHSFDITTGQAQNPFSPGYAGGAYRDDELAGWWARRLAP